MTSPTDKQMKWMHDCMTLKEAQEILVERILDPTDEDPFPLSSFIEQTTAILNAQAKGEK